MCLLSHCASNLDAISRKNSTAAAFSVTALPALVSATAISLSFRASVLSRLASILPPPAAGDVLCDQVLTTMQLLGGKVHCQNSGSSQCELADPTRPLLPPPEQRLGIPRNCATMLLHLLSCCMFGTEL